MCQFTDRFYSAVRTLAGDGPVKQRLLSAYSDNLESLSEADVPESIRESFIQMSRAMSAAAPLQNESAAEATVRKMSAAEASRHATNIVAMFSELVRAKSTGEKLRVVSRAEGKDAESSVPSNIALN